MTGRRACPPQLHPSAGANKSSALVYTRAKPIKRIWKWGQEKQHPKMAVYELMHSGNQLKTFCLHGKK